MPDKDQYWKQPELYRNKSLAYNRNNRDAVRERQKIWEAENPDKVKAIKTRYYEKNRETIKRKRDQDRRECKESAIVYLGGRCKECGIVDVCLDIYCFHHTNPEFKDFTISSRRTKFEQLNQS